MPQQFRVLVPDVRVRREPVLRTSAIIHNIVLQKGEIIIVDPNSRTVRDGFVWWKHADGWSASERENRSEILMEAIDDTPPTPPPPKPTPGQKLTFQVVTNGLRVRSGAGTTHAFVPNTHLSAGQRVEVDATSRTEVGGYIWWKHSTGWSASSSTDGVQVFMKLLDSGVDASANLLEVPWISQVDTVTAPGGFDCGQACVLMLLKYHNKVANTVTVKTLTNMLSGRTTAQNLTTLAGRFNHRLSAVSGLQQTVESIETLKKPLSVGRPIILLVDYLSLQFANPIVTTNPGLHWLVVTGYEGDTFYVHDPLWLAWHRNGQGGSYVPILVDTLTRAYRNAALV
jgi:uncharacterized protein YvpB